MLELGRGRNVAFGAGIAAHDDAAADITGDSTRLGQGQRNIRQRTERHHYDSRIRSDHVNDRVHGMLAFWAALRRRVASIAQPINAVEPLGMARLPQQRPSGAGINRNGRAAQFRRVQRVPRRLLDRNIARDDGDGSHLHIGLQGV